MSEPLTADLGVDLAGLDPELAARVAGLDPQQRARFVAILGAKLDRPAATGIPPAPGPGPWPASFGQERMWVGDRLAPAVHNYATALRLRGPLALPALGTAVARIVARHEVLRTTLRLAGDRLVQDVHPAVPVPVRLVDLGELGAVPEQPLPDPVRGLLRAEARRPFDLARGPLLRVVVYRLGPLDHCVLLTVHHAVTDGRSTAVFVAELSAGYRALAAGRPLPDDPLPLQYKDFACWQRDRLAGTELAALTDYWARATADLPRLELPADASPPAGLPAGSGGNHTFVLDRALTERLARLRAAGGGSRFMLVLAALVAVLRAVTGQSDLVVGTLAAGRTRPELDGLIGYFVNVLPLRFRVPARPTFAQLWALVRDAAQAGYAHQELPYETLLRTTELGRGAAPVRVVCVPHDPVPPVQLSGLAAEAIEVGLGTAPFDLVVEVRERDAGLQVAFGYDLGQFTAAAVGTVAGLLETALRRVADDPEVPCDDLFREAAQRPAQPVGKAPATTIHAAIEARAAAVPDRVAVVDGGRRVSYRALNAHANRLARHLRALGVRAEDRVGVCLDRSAGSVIAMLAVLKASAAYLALDPRHPAQRRAALAARAGIRVVVTAGGLAEGVPAAEVVRLDAHADRIARYPAADLGLPAHPEQAAYLIHTSGSTGAAKAVVAPHRGLLNRAGWAAREQPLGPGEVCAVRTPLTFVDSVWETFGPLIGGGTLAIVPEPVAADPDVLVDRLRAERAGRIVAVPGLLTMLLDAVPDLGARLPALTTWITSGEQLPATLVDRFRRAAPRASLVNLYGSSEVAADGTGAAVAGPRSGPPSPHRVPIGRPLTGVSAWVADPAGRAAPPLVPGELRVGGHGLARGYHGRPADTAAAFRPDRYGPPGARAYRTGDLTRWRADGQLEYLGRRDGQVQIRGHRVEPAEVEEALCRHPGVGAAAVTATADPAGGHTLVGYVVGTADPAELRAFLLRALPGYLVPSRLVPVEDLPRTGSGKLDRRALDRRALDREALDRDALPVPAATPASPVASGRVASGPVAVVAGAFAEVLGLPAVDPADDFFLIGGHSILAARLVHVLVERLGVRLGLADLFAAPTAAGLAALAASRPAARPGGDGAATGPLRPDPAAAHEPFPLTDVQAAYYVGRAGDLELGGVATHAYLELDVADLDLDRFAAALDAVVARHPMLRAVLRPDGTQRVLAEVPRYRVEVADLRGLPAGERAGRLAQVRDAMSHQVHDPYTWPLFAVRASLVAPGRAVLHVSIDSLICDAYSFGLVMDELTARYREPGRAWPELDLTFRDYVRYQVKRRGGAEYAAALGYWRDRLPTLPPGPDLPAGSQAGHHRFTRREGRLAAPRWAALKQRAATAGLTPSGLLLAAFAEILTRWSANAHYTLMLTVFQREPVHPEVGGIVGDFTQLIALEVDHTAPGPFRERAQALQRRLWSDLDRSMVSAVEVTREWLLARGLPAQPLSTVVFTSNLPIGGRDRAGTPARASGESAGTPPDGAVGRTNRTDPLGEMGYAITQTPQVSLDHQVGEEGGELRYNWDAVDSMFAPGVLDEMFAAYRALLDRLADEPAAWAAAVRVPLCAAAAARRTTANDTAGPLPVRCLHELVADAAARTPERVAVVDGDVRLCYRDLVARARRVGRALRNLGARRNTLVGVAARRGWQQVVAVLGVLESGAGYLPLDPELPVARLDHLVRRGEVAVVLTQAALRDALPLPGVRMLAVDDEAALPDGTGEPPEVCLDDLAYVIFTSGSTGEPKGVAIDHRGAANTIAAVNERFTVGPDDRVLAVSSLSFDLSVYDIFGLLAAGGTVVVPEHARRREPGYWARLVRAERVTVWNSVPALAELLVEHAEAVDPDALSSLRAVLLSGDWIPVRLPDRVRALTGARVMSLGGATEASIWSVWYPVGRVDPAWRSIPYGTPLRNQTLHVCDADFADRPDLVPGELYIGGTGVALGYWRDEALTAASFPRHPVTGQRLYRTGDLARYLPDGNLEFLGRRDNQVKISGYRIELGEAEAAIERTGEARAAAVVAAGAGQSRRLVGFVVPTDPDRFDLGRLRRRLTEQVPDYLVPASWRVLDALPLTGNGKIDRSALDRLASVPADEAPAPVDRPPAAPPDAGLVAKVAQLWCEVLGVPAVASDDSFFALGGTSLAAIRLLARVEQAWGVRVPLPDLFAAPTVAALAGAVASGVPSGAPAAGPVVADPGARYEPFPLTDIQQAYWLGRRARGELGGVATHSYLELDVVGLDLARLEASLGRLVDRHEALRTVIRADGRQQVLAEVPAYRIRVEDLRGRPEQEARAAGARWRDEMSHEVRDVSRWPLFDLRAQRLDGDRTRLYLSVDLLVVDARSMRILTGELLAGYADPGARQPALGLTFRDYVLAVQRLRGGPEYGRALEYWRQRLGELPDPPALPLRARPEDVAGGAFHRLATGLDPDAWRALCAWAGRLDLTPSAVVCTAFCAALAAYAESPRFTLNLTTFNRLPVHPDVDAVVGDFTATALLAVEYSGQSFVDNARRVQERIWRDLEHRLVSGVEVLRLLRRDPRGRAGALMPVVFTSALVSGQEPLPVRGWRAEPVYAVSQTPQVLLDHQVTEHAGRLVCSWDYVAEAFPPGLVEAMFDSFAGLLATLAGNAAQPATETVAESGGVLQ